MSSYKVKDSLLRSMIEMDRVISGDGMRRKKSFREHTDSELIRLMESMVDDGYVECALVHEKDQEKSVYLITQKGIDFIGDGGYTELKKDKEWKRKAERTNHRLTYYGKWAIFLAAIVGIIKALYELFAK